eukprot:m.53286 g.53286  ORF g.53286 m.53286 type:complete len:300 (+) comp18377_c0_seq3:118-1017(+)
MSLVDYSDDEDTSSFNPSTSQLSKRRRINHPRASSPKPLSPPPQLDVSAYLRESDSDSESDGEKNGKAQLAATTKIRQFAHVEGNWATHAHIKAPQIPVKPFARYLNSILSPEHGLHTLPDRHISLTKTVVLGLHQIETCVAAVKLCCSRTKSTLLELENIHVFTNESFTRAFLALQCTRGSDLLTRLVSNLDDILHEYDQPSFYKNPTFHVSLLSWTLPPSSFEASSVPEENVSMLQIDDNQKAQRKKALALDKIDMPVVEAIWQQIVKCGDAEPRFRPTHLRVKSGNKIFNLALATQ